MRSIRHMLRLKSYFNGIVSFNFPLPALFGIRNLHNHVIIGENVALTLQVSSIVPGISKLDDENLKLDRLDNKI